MEDIVIRRLQARDADDIVRIRKAITKEPSTEEHRNVIAYEADKDDRVSFVAEHKEKVVGYMIAYIIYGGFGLEKSAWIGVFGVDPKYMGSGIGKRLAKEIFEVITARGIRNIFTSVRWDSTDLLSFFKSLGFDRCEFINLKKSID
ncbi:MAG: GNAT family N-acetyltransferase [Deltaproteobacteria bacterium]|nr:GNAT family N-acetyltransferase [Deltaproteobacteria bacterium]MBW2077807.1 GNAT family N-acetyltransferase [Deltaproteobacteria bacterium]MBW2310594.1 GNAT family N-acetyltransferase [Deltaproteobacteria bacterium]RLB28450.1 MAG: GNAT family N-acetyltransferase [Deltaproteobacteria bacterium]